MGRTLWAFVGSLALAACGGRNQTVETGAEGKGGAQNLGGSPSVADASALAGFTGNELDIDTGEPQTESGPNTGSTFYWAYGMGNWFVYTPPPNESEADATLIELVPPRGDSTRAYRAAGSEPSGVDLFAQLRHPEGTPLDLSAFYGIGFWARLNGADQTLVVALGAGHVFPMTDLASVPHVSLAAAGDWLPYEIPFTEFGTDGSNVATIDFIVGQSAGTYDLWLNDLALLCRGECPGGGSG